MIWYMPAMAVYGLLWLLLPYEPLRRRVLNASTWCSVGVHDHSFYGWCRRCGHDEFGRAQQGRTKP